MFPTISTTSNSFLIQKAIEKNLSLVKRISEKYKWNITNEQYPFIGFRKDNNFFEIQREVNIVFNAEDCIVCTVLYNEERKMFSIKFRRLMKEKAMDKIFTYPKNLLSIEESKAICTFFVKERPDFDSILGYWNSHLFNKNK